jgi:D-glycerate 3-kinase
MIAGSQGSGKSSLSELIRVIYKKHYKKKVAIISIDDFYHSIKKRNQISRDMHPLFSVRGVPGTHDITLLRNVLWKIKKKQFPIYLPIFDKTKDARKKYRKKISSSDLVIFEGWCVGASPLPNEYLFKNINIIEKDSDKQNIWRKNYNRYLKDYQDLFKLFNCYIYILTPSWENVISWKYKQELKLRSQKSNLKLLSKLKKFIMYYEKITRWMMKNSKLNCNILIKIDKKQKFQKIIYK